ncbi:unnamed protein product, partial [Pylaiella littoralis]
MKAQLEIAQERVVALEATNKRLAEHEMLRTTTPADTFVGRQAGGGSRLHGRRPSPIRPMWASGVSHGVGLGQGF